MPDDVSASTRYRRLARECLEIAHTFPAGERRTVLLQMAQVWQRLADEYADNTAPLLRPLEGEQPAGSSNSRFSPRTTTNRTRRRWRPHPSADLLVCLRRGYRRFRCPRPR